MARQASGTQAGTANADDFGGRGAWTRISNVFAALQSLHEHKGTPGPHAAQILSRAPSQG